MKLVDDARSAWRWFSVQAMVLAGAVQMIWLQLPPDLKASVPDAWITYGTIALLVVGTFGRLVDQK
jgi:uncharacterized protein YecE (DUF72 family)